MSASGPTGPLVFSLRTCVVYVMGATQMFCTPMLHIICIKSLKRNYDNNYVLCYHVSPYLY